MKLGIATSTLSLVGSLGLSVAVGEARAGAGDHIRVGDAEVVPSLDLRGVYRSNIYLAEGETVSADGVKRGAAE